MKKLKWGIIIFLVVKIGHMAKKLNDQDSRIQHFSLENRDLKAKLRKANSDILLANKIIQGEINGTLLKGADGKVLYY